MAQVQCPNCGGYRVSDFGPYYLDPQTGKEVEPREGCVVALVAFGVVALLLLFVPGLVLAPDIDADTRLIGTVAVLAIGVFIVSAVYQWQRQKPRKETLARQWRYECVICGYEWRWREGQPRPRATVRPDLMRKGARRREEEEEERERDDMD